MNGLKKDLRKYYKKTRKSLICPFYAKLFIMKAIKRDINDFIIENNPTAIDEIVEKFGEPDTITLNFSKTEIKKLIHISRIIFFISIIILIIAIFSLVASIIIYHENGGIKIIIRGNIWKRFYL